MDSLETELRQARDLSVEDLADAIESIGFECTRCGACCKGHTEDVGDDPADGDRTGPDADTHMATIFPDEIRDIRSATGYDFRDVARPMPLGLRDGTADQSGVTFEWALQVEDCGDCTFYTEHESGTGACSIHPDRPLICQTYPFSVALGGTTQPMGDAVDSEGVVRAHECEGLGRDISREDAMALAGTLKERAVRDLEEAIGVRENYEPVDPDPGSVIVHDSEGQKRSDGTALERSQ